MSTLQRRSHRKPGFRRQVHGSASATQLEALIEDAEVVVEARGTFCPEPVIRMQTAARDMHVGQTAMLLADDAGVEVDVPAWCMSTGNEFLGLLREDAFLRAFVRRGQGTQ